MENFHNLFSLKVFLKTKLILVSTAVPTVVYFFETVYFFGIKNAKCWPILAHSVCFVANLCPFWFTFRGLNSAMMQWTIMKYVQII